MSGLTPHNEAPEGAYARTVLMPGDPLRAELIATKFLDPGAKRVNNVRGINGWTGTFEGVPVSVHASGMGQPSLGIYAYELYNSYGVENIIRIGSCGAYTSEINLLDVFLTDEAYSESTFAQVLNGEPSDTLKPSGFLNGIIAQTASEIGLDLARGRVHSSDVFYNSDLPDGTPYWQFIKDKQKLDVVEMESFALFATANLLDKNAACLLTVSDHFLDDKRLSTEERQTSFEKMIEVALRSVIKLEGNND